MGYFFHIILICSMSASMKTSETTWKPKDL